MIEKKAHWLEVSLVVDGELAEAVAELMSRYVTDGVVCEQAVEYDKAGEKPVPVGSVCVYGYIAVHDELDTLRQKLEEGFWHMNQIVELPQPNYCWVEDQDWMEVFKDHYHPIPVGKHLIILPAWVRLETKDRIPVRIDPSMAFGTGTHPTTQLSMQLLEKYVKPGEPLMDIGCGSGILSITAIKLGAVHSIAVDISPSSVTGTVENAERNHVLDAIEVGRGSVKEIVDGEYSMKQAPLLVANILTPVLIRLFDAGMADLVTPGGTVLLSGILESRLDEILTKTTEVGLELVEQIAMKDWVGLAFHKPA
ncbi:MAG: 50S ribosomal protein L11 methyltransferase [Anaerolineaceae bacterium]|nr:50S ribosomal protein L11 methyltransferase [Anaerolineaceae bacterium]